MIDLTQTEADQLLRWKSTGQAMSQKDSTHYASKFRSFLQIIESTSSWTLDVRESIS